MPLTFIRSSDDNFPTQTSSFGNEFFNASDHWNILPSISYIGVSRSVGDALSVGVRGSLNKIDKLGDVGVDDLIILRFRWYY